MPLAENLDCWIFPGFDAAITLGSGVKNTGQLVRLRRIQATVLRRLFHNYF